MMSSDFQIGARPYLYDAYCKCGNKLKEVSNGLLSKAMFCPTCEKVYLLKLVKVPDKNITREFIEQCRKESK